MPLIAEKREMIFGTIWTARDEDGGRWFPGVEAQRAIEAADDPAAETLRICDSDPMLGEWRA